jgi:hypothetical protein
MTHPSIRPQGVDGVLLVIDPSRADQGERELQSLYLHFAQPAGLTTRQCMVLAVDVGDAAVVGGNAAWQGARAGGRAGRRAGAAACVAPPLHLTRAQLSGWRMLQISCLSCTPNHASPGLKGKLGRLQSGYVSLSPAAPEAGAQEARQHLGKLLSGCLARKRDQAQRAVLGESEAAAE